MPVKHLEFLGDGACRCIINSGEHSVSKQRHAYLNTRAGGERAEGKLGEQTQQREPVLGEGLQPHHVIFKVGMEGRDCEYEMESCRAVLV